MIKNHSIKHLIKRWVRPQMNYYDLDGFYHRKAIFIHIPKTGGVSISKSIFHSLGGGHATYLDYTNTFTSEEMEEFFVFTFVRHPISRFLSAVNFLYGGGMDIEDLEWSEKYLVPYENINTFVLQELRNHIDSKFHFKTQSSYLYNIDGVIDIDFIGKHENLLSDFEIIKQRLNLKSKLGHHNKSKSNIFSQNQLNKKSIAILEEIYEADFQLLNYSKS